MISYKELINLCEGKQRGSLYHYTSTENAHDILDGNTLYASELNEPRSVSTTRDKNFHFGSRMIGNRKTKAGVNADVSFELDGTKLSQKKKIKPFNFLGFSGIGKSKFPNDESEEQIHGDIDNVKSYIKKIRLHGNVHSKDLEKLKKHGIPIEHHY